MRAQNICSSTEKAQEIVQNDEDIWYIIYLFIFRPKLYEEEIHDKEEASCYENFESAQCDKFSYHICHQHMVSHSTFST